MSKAPVGLRRYRLVSENSVSFSRVGAHKYECRFGCDGRWLLVRADLDPGSCAAPACLARMSAAFEAFCISMDFAESLSNGRKHLAS
jgi:hypothetical protein